MRNDWPVDLKSITYFHRNLKAGFSINKVAQTVIRNIPNKSEYYVPCAGASLSDIFKNLLFVWKHRDKKAINHVTGDVHYCILALIGCKSVLTIHDTVSLDFISLPKYKKLIIEWLWFRLPLKIATKVVCISEETRRCVLRYTHRTDIEVIYNAIDPMFKFCSKDCVLDIPNILLIGTNPNKNLFRTFEALHGIKCKLIIIGHLNDEHLKALHNYHLDYENREGLTDEQLLDEYIKCDIVSFISLFEGFGMIVIEANKVGRPVICSDIPVLKEIAGDSAVFVDPLNVDDIRNGYMGLLNNSLVQKTNVNKGVVNVERFASSLITRQWVDLYSKIC